MTRPPHRPVMRYHGGKWRLAPWVISHFPPHRIYAEPFGGAASVLLRKPRSFAEVYNDLDEDVVNVFRVLRDPEEADRLRRLVGLTPWSRREFELCYEPTEDRVEWARRTISRSFMAHGTTSRRKNRTGFRAKAYRQNQTGAQDWAGWPSAIPAFVERLQGVTIECRPALDLIRQQDTPDTLFYCDPPYTIGSRTSVRNGCQSDRTRAYAVDLTDDDHLELAAALRSIKGMAVVSGYASPFYDELYEGWVRRAKGTNTDGGGRRVEVLWISPNAVPVAPTLGLGGDQ